MAGGRRARARGAVGLPVFDRCLVAPPGSVHPGRSVAGAQPAVPCGAGGDPDGLGIRYDVRPRPGRPPIPVAFTIGMGAWAVDQPADAPWTPRPPWVFATYAEGGLGNLAELLHESGHAIQGAAIRTRPAYFEWPEEGSAFLEGTADVLGWDADEPAWQRHWLGEAADPREALLGRYGNVILDVAWALFEIELHRHPERRPNDVWTEITSGRPRDRAPPGVVVVGPPGPAHRPARLSPTTRSRRSWPPRSGRGSWPSAGRGSRATQAGTGSCRMPSSWRGRRGRRRSCSGRSSVGR